MPVYTTEGGWLHHPAQQLVDETLAAKAQGFRGAKMKVGKPSIAEDVARLSAVRDAVGDAFEIMVDANQAFTVAEACRRAHAYRDLALGWFEEPLPAEDLGGHVELAAKATMPIAVGESIYHPAHFREYLERARLLGRSGRLRPHRRHHAVAQGGAPCRNFQRRRSVPIS